MNDTATLARATKTSARGKSSARGAKASAQTSEAPAVASAQGVVAPAEAAVAPAAKPARAPKASARVSATPAVGSALAAAKAAAEPAMAAARPAAKPAQDGRMRAVAPAPAAEKPAAASALAPAQSAAVSALAVAKPAAEPAPAAAKPAAPEAGTTTHTIGVSSKAEQDDRTGRFLISGTFLAIAISFLISRRGYYTPGDDVGYYLGLVGGVMMLLLLTYPLRKYLQSFRNWGPVRHWFSFHMFLGVAGPVLVIAHSTFILKSTNATIAFICMLVVAGSGIIGRFIYVRIHRGLHGEKLNFKELQTKAGFESEEMHSKLHFVPEVENRLTQFQAYAFAENLGFANSALRLFTLGTRRRIAYAQCAAELRRVMRERAEIRQWDRDKLRRRLGRATRLVDEFLVSVQKVSQFDVYDRLFRLWHVAHVPLVYLLVLSGIAHVVAVHMY
jgi:hypothetical protein